MLNCFEQQVLPVGRDLDVLVHARRANQSIGPVERDQHQLVGEVVLEKRLIVRVLQQILEGRVGRGLAGSGGGAGRPTGTREQMSPDPDGTHSQGFPKTPLSTGPVTIRLSPPAASAIQSEMPESSIRV